MSTRAHKLIEEFFSLPETEQAEVLEAIVPVEELEPEFRAELERRGEPRLLQTFALS